MSLPYKVLGVYILAQELPQIRVLRTGIALLALICARNGLNKLRYSKYRRTAKDRLFPCVKRGRYV